MHHVIGASLSFGSSGFHPPQYDKRIQLPGDRKCPFIRKHFSVTSSLIARLKVLAHIIAVPILPGAATIADVIFAVATVRAPPCLHAVCTLHTIAQFPHIRQKNNINVDPELAPEAEPKDDEALIACMCVDIQ